MSGYQKGQNMLRIVLKALDLTAHILMCGLMVFLVLIVLASNYESALYGADFLETAKYLLMYFFT